MYRILNREQVIDVLNLSLKISTNINEPVEYVFKTLYDGISRKSSMHFDNLGIAASCFQDGFFDIYNTNDDDIDIEQAIASIKKVIHVL
ncbi:MAG: hypothetical protein KAI86_01680 [Desulfobacterales bacterium]|nr:hypothetical protein [Desulfobacterales bacterium]